MRKFALYAAVAATTMAGMGTMTSQASVKAYVIGGNYGGNCSNGMSVGNGNSLNEILQMVTSGGAGSGLLAPTLPGTLDNPLTPNGSGNWGNVLKPDGNGSWNCPVLPDCSGSWNCPTGPDCFGGTNCPGNQNPGNQNPGDQNPGNPNPGDQNPGTQYPGDQNPGDQYPGDQNPGNQDPEQPTDQERAYIQQVITLVNEERAKAGLSPVTEAGDVAAAASVRAREIPGNFSHSRPNGTYYNTALDEGGVKYRGSGENIAYGQRTAAEVMNGWMNSQGHRANILNGNYTNIGVGYYENGSGVKYWVQLFTY